MQRTIIELRHAEAEGWVAELSCGHTHAIGAARATRPSAPTIPEGAAIGTELACPRCDRFELPAGFAAYKRTAEFDERSIPAGLLKDHTTKPAVWGVIHVRSGRLRYLVEAPLTGEHRLDEAHPGIVVPEVRHRVAADGPVRFYVEFHRAERRAATPAPDATGPHRPDGDERPS